MSERALGIKPPTEHPQWIKEYSNLNVVVEIVHLPPDSQERWKNHKHYPPTSPVVQKLTRIDDLDKAGVVTFLWEVGSARSIPSDRRSRILGGGVYEICVKGRKGVLEGVGIEVTIDPSITLYENDFEKK